MALNILSTGVMVRLGKVYGNRMVDVAVTNSKLEDRALRILADLAGVARIDGRRLLQETQGSVKVALLMALRQRSTQAARELLDRHHGNLRSALAD
jgi:N-acetylmuramic acid 6-phosphate etherase